MNLRSIFSTALALILVTHPEHLLGKSKGARGDMGPQGVQGPMGPIGPMGLQGPAGADAIAAYAFYHTTNEMNIIGHSEPNWFGLVGFSLNEKTDVNVGGFVPVMDPNFPNMLIGVTVPLTGHYQVGFQAATTTTRHSFAFVQNVSNMMNLGGETSSAMISTEEALAGGIQGMRSCPATHSATVYLTAGSTLSVVNATERTAHLTANAISPCFGHTPVTAGLSLVYLGSGE